MTKEELLSLLRELTDLVEANDSWEGLVNWLRPEPGDGPSVDFRVEARYRIGNSQGQGGFNVIGDWVDKDDQVIRHVNPQRGLG